ASSGGGEDVMTRQHRTRRRLAAPALPGSTESPGGEGRFEEGPDARQCRRGFAGGSTPTIARACDALGTTPQDLCRRWVWSSCESDSGCRRVTTEGSAA